MCGIIGFVGKNNIDNVFSRNYKSIKDRGIYFDYTIKKTEAFGYARLPTDAIKNKSLNKIKRSGSFLLYNGFITNAAYLVSRFSLSSFAKESDTLVLKLGFEKYGKLFLERCRGMFAFAYVTKKTITLCRDTIGIKPLYYIYDKDIFGFCSEIKGLINGTKAMVYELLPGQMLVYNRKLHKIKKENFNYKSLKRSNLSLKKCFEESLVPSVDRYLKKSDKKIAVLISGGLDSSIILQMLYNNFTQHYRKQIICFCIGLANSSDVEIARRLAGELGFKFMKITPYSLKNSNRILPEIVYKTESPFARVARVALLQDALARKMQQMGIHIVLSGEGADELFFGYPRFIVDLKFREIKKSFRTFFKTVFPGTLLQRYDRVFARRQIEGRVPFLDQEIVSLAQHYKVSELIGSFSRKYFSKLPLRRLAKEVGLPDYIYLRPKITMTRGATNKNNRSGGEFQNLVSKYYLKNFGKNRIDQSIEARANEKLVINNLLKSLK